MTLRAPVALFAFNRPDMTARVFAAIRAARPSRLFLVCDGPRAGRAGEAAQCAEVRRLLAEVDWPCTVEREYSDVNLGCRARISSGIEWVFSRVEEAIFLEDDTLPEASFFPYCDELLARYRDDERVMMITGFTLLDHGGADGASYWFSSHSRVWGWASWRAAWQGYDVHMRDWPEAFTRTEAWTRRTRAERAAWGPFFDAVKSGAVDTWDAQVTLHAWRTSRVTAIPRGNLITNIGFGSGTNTANYSLPQPAPVPMPLPLQHPAEVRASRALDAEWLLAEHGAPVGAVRRVLRHARATLRHYVRRARRWWPVLSEYRPGIARTPAGPRRVLVVRLDNIGDFVLWTGAARAMRRWLGPDAHVTLAANATWADLARDAGVADEVWPVDRGALEADGAYRAELRRRVEGGGFSLAINPRYTREMLLGDSLMRWSRARERLGMIGDGTLLPPRERFWADRWYTRLLATSPASEHETERNAEFLRGIGAPVQGVPEPSLKVPPLAETEGLGLPADYFVVFPGASLPEPRWSPAGFAEVARHIARRTGWRPVLLGEAADTPYTSAVAESVPDAVDLTGRTTVRAFAAVIQGARLAVTNDTSALHLAAASGVHAVCIAGGWHWGRFVPYPAVLGGVAQRVHAVSMVAEMTCFNCNGRCIIPHPPRSARPCITRVTVARVIETVDDVLSTLGVKTDG
ncbi:MAG: glycosyltransferase family 9 protein [Gemmatimonadaceae bacterium]